jgi:integrase
LQWDAHFDKGRRERRVPIPSALAERVKQLRRQLEAFGDGWLFPTENGQKPWPREVFDQALRRAETKAELPKLEGSLWHAYRRKWNTERKHLPECDRMAVAGWRDRTTMNDCYTVEDYETMLAVLECPNKLMSKELSGNE